MTVLVFLLLTVGLLTVDMYGRPDHQESLSRASLWTAAYFTAAMVFAIYLYASLGEESASLFISGYVIEKSLSVDNLIVFGTVFTYFGIPDQFQYRVLKYGIIGSAVLRLVFIAIGLAGFWLFGRVLDVAFGVFVIWSAWKIAKAGETESIDHEKRWYIRFLRHIIPISATMDGKFFNREGHFYLRGKQVMSRLPAVTPLLLCLVAMEITDIAFAFDSVPAVIGITHDTLLAYSAVMFAVLGLRSMYFMLLAVKNFTPAVSKAVCVILILVGLKMLFHGLISLEIPAFWTLATIMIVLALGGTAGMIDAVKARIK